MAEAHATRSLAEASNQKATLYIVSPSGKPVWCSDGGVDPGRLATTSAVVSACVAIASIKEIDAGDRKIVIDRRGELIFVASGWRESAAALRRCTAAAHLLIVLPSFGELIPILRWLCYCSLGLSTTWSTLPLQPNSHPA